MKTLRISDQVIRFFILINESSLPIQSHFLDYDIEQMMVHEKYCSLQYDEDRCRLKDSLKISKKIPDTANFMLLVILTCI